MTEGSIEQTFGTAAFLRHPDLPDWVIGQVQSVIGHCITVNFENAGKHLINGAVIRLVLVDEEAG